MCETRCPKVICGSVGLKENLSAGMVSDRPLQVFRLARHDFFDHRGDRIFFLRESWM